VLFPTVMAGSRAATITTAYAFHAITVGNSTLLSLLVAKANTPDRRVKRTSWP